MGLAMGIDDSIPHYCLRRRTSRGRIVGGIRCGNPHKQLLCVPVEERCEV